MKRTQLFTKTRKNAPSDEVAKNAQLLIRAGFVSKEMAGVYAYLPLGLKVIENVAQIVREEMNAIGGNELKMTTLLSKEPWEKTDRWDEKKVDNWFKSKLASGADVGIGLTHEEPVIMAVKQHANSYKDFPIYTYQIQNKFRNELRAKSGLMRGREFLMKDLYSFSRTRQEHDDFYERCISAYMNVYNRVGFGDITYKTFASGGIFSKYSHEFQTLSPVGEDTIYVHEEKSLAINKEVLEQEVLDELGIRREDLVEKTAVEVGNIFSLGSKYADALDFKYVDEQGKQQSLIMGCYGIGVSRLMGLVAEHFADEKGLSWPINIAPYHVYLATIGDVDAQAQELYNELQSQGVEVLWDDRDVRPGEKFADADLMGIPMRVVISNRLVESNTFEFKLRSDKEAQILTKDDLLAKITSQLDK